MHGVKIRPLQVLYLYIILKLVKNFKNKIHLTIMSHML